MSWRTQKIRSLQSEEYKNLRPDARRVREAVNTKGLEGSEYNKNSCPAMVEREREMDKELICEICRTVGLLDDVVDVLRSKLCCQRAISIKKVTGVTHCHSGAD